MSRKLIITLLALLLVSTTATSAIALTPGTTEAFRSSVHTWGPYTFVFTSSDYSTAEILKYNSKYVIDNLTIPTHVAYGNYGLVTSIADYAFDSVITFTYLHIPDSVRTIGKYAFAHSLVYQAYMGKNVTSIGDYAFYQCPQLYYMTFYGNRPSIGDYAFYDSPVTLIWQRHHTATPPIAQTSPTGSDVPVNTTVTVGFGRAMDEAATSISIEGVTGTVSWDGNNATFTPSSPLAYNTTYAVNVSGWDLGGNSFNKTWSFTTESATHESPGTVTGTVRDACGDAVAGATVTLCNGMTTMTDCNGNFEFNGLFPGSYRVTVTADGYEATTRCVSVTSGTDLGTLTLQTVPSSSEC